MGVRLVSQQVSRRTALAETTPEEKALHDPLEPAVIAEPLAVIADTAEVLTDIIDTRRSLRLEIIIVVLIAVELVIAGYQTLH